MPVVYGFSFSRMWAYGGGEVLTIPTKAKNFPFLALVEACAGAGLSEVIGEIEFSPYASTCSLEEYWSLTPYETENLVSNLKARGFVVIEVINEDLGFIINFLPSNQQHHNELYHITSVLNVPSIEEQGLKAPVFGFTDLAYAQEAMQICYEDSGAMFVIQTSPKDEWEEDTNPMYPYGVAKKTSKLIPKERIRGL